MKWLTVFIGIFTLISTFTLSFDPFHSLEKLILQDLIGSPIMSTETQSVFNFLFLLFCLITLVVLIFQYYLIVKALAKVERWAFDVLLISSFLWIIGASLITLYTGANYYFASVGAMVLAMFPQLVILWPFFSDKKA